MVPSELVPTTLVLLPAIRGRVGGGNPPLAPFPQHMFHSELIATTLVHLSATRGRCGGAQ